MQHIDSVIVAAYFVLILAAGWWIGRRHHAGSADDFISGGRTRSWWQIGLALLGMAVDPGYMSIAGLGFVWGLYLTQWTGVHVWFTTWLAAMFFVPVYWRSHIVTTPEFLERRFNVQTRVVFSLLMAVLLVLTLALGLYLGGLLLQELLGWSLRTSVICIAAVTGFYVLLGGMRTVLVLDTYQAIFLLVTLLLVGGMAIYQVGGISGLAAIAATNAAGTRLPSVLPPSDWRLDTEAFFPVQAILLWSTVVGLSWLACNFGMAQRLLAARSERDAQKSLLFVGALVVVVPTCSFLVGVAMRHLHPDIVADTAFIRLMIDAFPVGLRGVLAAGMMAALLSTADGLLTGSSGLLCQDIYLRFVRPGAGEAERKWFVRGVEVVSLAVAMLLVPVLAKSPTAMGLLQAYYADLFGVIVALYLAGMFTTRATPWAALSSVVLGLATAIVLDVCTSLNFAYVGFFSFAATLGLTLVLSRFESPVPRERLANLTVHTLEDVKGPWVGLHAWPALWRWALALAAGWFGLSAAWEVYVRSR